MDIVRPALQSGCVKSVRTPSQKQILRSPISVNCHNSTEKIIARRAPDRDERRTV
jgi:hypothetical protein